MSQRARLRFQEEAEPFCTQEFYGFQRRVFKEVFQERRSHDPDSRAALRPGSRHRPVRHLHLGHRPQGFRENEAEAFCRLVGPNSRVPYAVRECTDYCDRRVRMTASEVRRYGFVTEIRLDAEDIRSASED